MRQSVRGSKAFVAAFAAVVLLGAGCTQSSDSEGSSGSDGPATTDSGSGESGGGATAPGVTADTVKIGYSYLDFDDLVSKGLSTEGWGDQELAFQTFVDDLNDKGGINDRKVEVAFAPYTPLGTEVAEAVCLELTDDEDVFAVVGGFLGPAEPANTCIVGQQETVLAGGVQSEERLAEARAPWIADRPLRTRQADILLNLLEAEGKLDGAKVAVVASVDAEDVREDVVDTLGKYDITPVSVIQSDVAVGDITAEDNAWATFAERARSDGANTVLLVGNVSAGIRNIASQGLDVDTWILDSETLTQTGTSVDLEDARGVLAAAPLTGQELWDDETTKECRDIYTKANPDVEIIEPEDLKEGDERTTQGIITSCRFFSLFTQVAEKAGPNLTNESFAQAVSDMGGFSLPGEEFSSLGPDKFDANDSFLLGSFNPDLGENGDYDALTDISDATP